MLTSKQIKSLPKGEYTNMDLAKKFGHHGKQNRQISLPVDKNGNLVNTNIHGWDKVVSIRIMRLGRRAHKDYSV